MDKMFPPMYSKPEKIQTISLIPFWAFSFVFIPIYMPYIGFGLWEQWEVSVWLEIVYHVINGVGILFLMWSYLKEEWFMVTTDIRFYLNHVAQTVGLILGTELVLLFTLHFCGVNIAYMLESLPSVEMSVSHTPLFVVELQPVFGTIALSVFSPISICGLFYCLGFAPVCYKKTWLAYLCIAVITLIPPVIDILWRGEAALVLSGYLVNLLACWSYQKTNNVWTPIATLMITNLLVAIFFPILLF